MFIDDKDEKVILSGVKVEEALVMLPKVEMMLEGNLKGSIWYPSPEPETMAKKKTERKGTVFDAFLIAWLGVILCISADNESRQNLWLVASGIWVFVGLSRSEIVSGFIKGLRGK